VAAVGAGACVSTVAAQEVSKADVIVVTGTAVPVDQEKIGNSITVVGSEQIEDGGYNYTADVLRQVPGLAINRTGGFGGLTEVRTRGSEANHTVVLFNGVDVSDAGNGQTDLSSLYSANIDRIEILRGPQSGLYGSNALAGVINILTRKNVDGSYINANAEAGSFNTFTATVGGGAGNGKSFIDAAIGGTRTDGFDISALGAINGPPGVTGDKEGANNVTGYVSGGYELNPALRFDGFVRYVKAHGEGDGQDFNYPPDATAGQYFDDASQFDTETYNVAGSGTLSLMDGKWVTVLRGDYTHNETKGGDGTPFGSYGDRAYRGRYGLQSSYTFGPENFVNTITGFAEDKKEWYESGSEHSRNLVGVGVQYAGEFAKQFYLSATLRHDDNDKFEDDTTGGVAGSWVIHSSGTRLHASYGTGVTNPSFFEQFGFDPTSFIGNPNLKPEKAWGYDFGVEQALLNKSLVVDLTYFKSRLDDEINYGVCTLPNPNNPGGFLTSSCNVPGKSNREGAELSVRYNPTTDIDLIGSYTHLKATSANGAKELRRPDNQASLDANWRLISSKLQLNAGVTYNGEQLDTDFSTFMPVRLSSYTLVRLGASWKLTDTIDLYGRVENVTGEKYQEVFGVLTPKRAAYIGIRFKEAKH
jgi:vitamin B12 transporter